MDIQKFKSMSLLDIVYSQIKDDILKGKYKPGERLIISKISQDLGVSHTPINEALNRLMMEGYVDFIPRKGMKVREIDTDEIIETYEIRKMCELFYAEKMIERAKEEKSFVQEIKVFAHAMANIGFQGVVGEKSNIFFENESNFHLTLMSSCNNNKLFNIYTNLKANSMFFYKIIFDDMLYTEERYKETLNEHMDIVNALEKHDIKMLQDALRAHTQNSIDFICYSSERKMLRMLNNSFGGDEKQQAKLGRSDIIKGS
jgi:DNA-binding GntR family transcriptional regulator